MDPQRRFGRRQYRLFRGHREPSPLLRVILAGTEAFVEGSVSVMADGKAGGEGTGRASAASTVEPLSSHLRGYRFLVGPQFRLLRFVPFAPLFIGSYVQTLLE